jgi:hypothetical protein
MGGIMQTALDFNECQCGYRFSALEVRSANYDYGCPGCGAPLSRSKRVLSNDSKDDRIAELEAALDDILTYVEKYTRMVNTDPGRLQRAKDALAKEPL